MKITKFYWCDNFLVDARLWLLKEQSLSIFWLIAGILNSYEHENQQRSLYIEERSTTSPQGRRAQANGVRHQGPV